MPAPPDAAEVTRPTAGCFDEVGFHDPIAASQLALLHHGPAATVPVRVSISLIAWAFCRLSQLA